MAEGLASFIDLARIPKRCSRGRCSEAECHCHSEGLKSNTPMCTQIQGFTPLNRPLGLEISFIHWILMMHDVFKWTKVHKAIVQQLWLTQSMVCRASKYDNGYGVLPDMGNSAESREDTTVDCLIVSNGERLVEESPNPLISYLRATGSQGVTVCFSNSLSQISQKRYPFSLKQRKNNEPPRCPFPDRWLLGWTLSHISHRWINDEPYHSMFPFLLGEPERWN